MSVLRPGHLYLARSCYWSIRDGCKSLEDTPASPCPYLPGALGLVAPYAPCFRSPTLLLIQP